MKTDLQELIDTAKTLSLRLEEAANKEREFCVDLQLEFEKMSWEMLRLGDELQSIKEMVG